MFNVTRCAWGKTKQIIESDSTQDNSIIEVCIVLLILLIGKDIELIDYKMSSPSHCLSSSSSWGFKNNKSELPNSSLHLWGLECEGKLFLKIWWVDTECVRLKGTKWWCSATNTVFVGECEDKKEVKKLGDMESVRWTISKQKFSNWKKARSINFHIGWQTRTHSYLPLAHPLWQTERQAESSIHVQV